MDFLKSDVAVRMTFASSDEIISSSNASGACEISGYNTVQYNTIQSNLFQLSYMSIIIIIYFIFLNEKSKRTCRKVNKLIRDIPRNTHNQFT